jgi:hypothetical protein
MKTSANYNRHSMPEWQPVWDEEPARGVWTHDDLPDDTLLYRYTPLERGIDTLRTNAFLMRSPRAWDDPYERWWCDTLFAPHSKLAKAHAFGLCWTTRYLDEPVWRIYMCPAQPEVPALRISTTAAKLRARMTELARAEVGKAFLGRVRYTASERLPELAQNLMADPNNHLARTAGQALLWKRAQFELEEEVRLLWIVTAADSPDMFPVSFNTGLIEQVRIGPTTNEAVADDAYDRLLAAGVPEDWIEYSTIYRPPGSPPRRRHPT